MLNSEASKMKEWTKILLFTTTLGTLITLQFGSVFSFTGMAILIGYAIRFVRLTKKEVIAWTGSAIIIGLAILIVPIVF